MELEAFGVFERQFTIIFPGFEVQSISPRVDFGLRLLLQHLTDLTLNCIKPELLPPQALRRP